VIQITLRTGGGVRTVIQITMAGGFGLFPRDKAGIIVRLADGKAPFYDGHHTG
jgi:hypothetical protein